MRASFGGEGVPQWIAECSVSIVAELPSGRICWASNSACELFGYIHGGLVGMEVHDLVVERLRAKHKEHFAHYGKDPKQRQMGGAAHTLYGVRKDGTELVVEIALHPRAISGRVYVAAIILPMRLKG